METIREASNETGPTNGKPTRREREHTAMDKGAAKYGGPVMRCTCGAMSNLDPGATDPTQQQQQQQQHQTRPGTSHPSDNDNDNEESTKSAVWLESLWVHLLTPRENNSRRRACHEEDKQQPHGFAERHRHLTKLLEAAYLCSDETDDATGSSHSNNNNNNNNNNMELCLDCIERVAAALEADTQRLYAEIDAYEDTVRTAKQRQKTFEQHVAAALPTEEGEDPSSAVNMNMNMNMNATVTTSARAWPSANTAIEDAYRHEIAMLERDVETQADELAHYKHLHHQETLRARELELLQEQLHMERNALDKHSEAFDHRLAILTQTLEEVQTEVDKLTCVALPRVVFELKVDTVRGLHYPLINQLRLAFRPRGDLVEQEIKVAWAQATQLLLGLGNLLNYPSPDWKLVPLVDCAKLIYRKKIYNLEPGACGSLTAWNALLDQIVKHALSLPASCHGSSDPPGPPYESSATRIGTTELKKLDEMDHSSWSDVIQKMASNLLWLSDRASGLAATQVQSTTHCVV